MSEKRIALLSVIVGAILVSVVTGITKKGLEGMPPLTFAALRFFVSSLVILPFFLQKRRRSMTHVKQLTPLSLLAAVNVIFFIWGVKLTVANVGNIIYAAVPLLTGVMLFILFKEKINKEKINGILIGFIGVLIIVLLPILEKNQLFVGNLTGNIFLASAVIIWSLYTVYVNKFFKDYSPFTLTSNFIFTTTIILIPFFIWDLYYSSGWWNNITGWTIFSILYVAIITVVTYILNHYAIRHGGAVFAATTFYITPVLGFLTNFLLLGEVLTPGFIFGTAIALLGAYLVMRK